MERAFISFFVLVAEFGLFLSTITERSKEVIQELHLDSNIPTRLTVPEERHAKLE